MVEGGVLGDLVLCRGPGGEAWANRLDGYTVLSRPSEPVQVAVRGSVACGGEPDGASWLAIADLVEGRLADGAGALDDGPVPQAHWRGRFIQVVWDRASGRAAGLTDHFSTLSLYVLAREDVLLLGTDLRVLATSPWCRRELDLESVYHYLNFAHIPAPGTLYPDIRRLPPGTRFRWKGGRGYEDRYYLPEYPEDLRGSDAALSRELRERIVASVRSYRPEGGVPWGCFLSGGTDSSSILSILCREGGGGPVRSFSIGFEERDYDELAYARIAARACGAEASFERVSRERAQALTARIIEAYDQPFGNSSAIATLACADLAREHGMKLLLAGDGGDEIFGGNERYAKDKIMEAWFSLPGPVRSTGRALGRFVRGNGSHFLNRVSNFFERASLANPERFYTDDSFASDHYQDLLRPGFRGAVARDASLELMRDTYGLGRSGGPLHRIMRLDLLMAIAQNDLRKVHGTTRAVGVSVRFPFLDPLLVAFTGRLPESHKVRGLKKRHLFKLAMEGILPAPILRKKKQGFGLPIAVWLRHDGGFRSAVRDVILDRRARARDWFDGGFVERMLAEHLRGSWDHSDNLWRLFVLELWLRRWFDAS